MKITSKIKEQIAPEMFGLFFEDINFAADGGLYAEMIENRSFEAKEAHGLCGKFYAIDDNQWGWSPVADDKNERPRMMVVTGTPLSSVNPHYLRVVAGAAKQGFKNKAYDGIYLEKGEKYKVSFYARCVEYTANSLTVSVEKDGKTYACAEVAVTGKIPYAPFTDLGYDWITDAKDAFEEEIVRITKEAKKLSACGCSRESDWNKCEVVLTADETVEMADFVIRFKDAGAIEFDLISMIPENAVAGVFRKDIFETLKEMKPGFIRFPGGCIVEGISLDNRYYWKQTVGDLKDRRYIPNLWAFNDDRTQKDLDLMRPVNQAHYGQSYGIGFYEYFLLCELLGAKPLPVLTMAVACQFRSTELVTIDSEEFKNYIQDALDLIEFANGDVTTKWGGLRAKMGHPAPFNLELLSIGNEQWETSYVDIGKRHEIFEKAVHDVYPDIKLLGTAGPGIDNPIFYKAWDFYRDGAAKNEHFCYAIDEHYYVAPQWLYDHVDFYDNYSRDIAVFAGEYAAHTSTRSNDMEAALSEASFMTGLEKNAGVVKLASYAPLFNRVGYSQWTPDMIWFDAKNIYKTPSYYVQMLYATNVGDHTLDMEGQEKELRKDGIYVSLTETASGERILKASNVSDKDYVLELVDETGQPIKADGLLKTLCAIGEAGGEMPQEATVVENATSLAGSVTLKKESFNVLRF